jgi:hypothetical protein
MSLCGIRGIWFFTRTMKKNTWICISYSQCHIGTITLNVSKTDTYGRFYGIFDEITDVLRIYICFVLLNLCQANTHVRIYKRRHPRALKTSVAPLAFLLIMNILFVNYDFFRVVPVKLYIFLHTQVSLRRSKRLITLIYFL